MLDDATWLALTAVLTAARRAVDRVRLPPRAAPPRLRGAGLTLLPAAALLTGTLELGTEIVDAVVDWATGLVFNPCCGRHRARRAVGGAVRRLRLRCRSRGIRRRRADPEGGGRRSSATSCPPSKQAEGAPAIDDDLADIEAILKKRGIT